MTENKKPAAAPDALVTDKRINFGTFDMPPRDMNMLDAEVFGPLVPRALRKLRFKQWQFFLFAHPRFALGMAVIDMGVLPASFIYVYDRETHKYTEHKRQGPGCNVSLADSLYEGRCHARTGKYSIEIHNQLDAGLHEVKIDIAASGKHAAIKAELSVHQAKDSIKPLVVSLPVDGPRGMYSHKMAAPATGTLRVGDVEVTFDAARDFALMDEHKAFYPHHFFWDWACFGFRNKKGELIGANLTDNLIKDQRAWNENAIWTPGGISLLGPVRFEYDLKDIMKPWKINDLDGQVELEFQPLGAKVDTTNLLVLRNDYRQPFGTFSGKLVDGAGRTHEVKDAFGVTEYYDAYL